MGNNLMVLMLVAASVGQSHQMSVSIDHVVKKSPCPDANRDCFPIYYRVCVDLIEDSRSCSRTSHTCNDPFHCVGMKMDNKPFPRLLLPQQTVTNETFIKISIAESVSEGNPCRTASALDCRYLNTSYQFSNVNFSFQVTLSDIPATSTFVSTPIHTDPTTSLPSSGVSSTSYPSTGSSTSTLTSPLLSTSGDINQTSVTASPTGISLTSTRGITSPPPDTETAAGKGPLVGGIIGGSAAVIIAVIIACCCWKPMCRSNAVVPTVADTAVYNQKVQIGPHETFPQDVKPSLPPIKASGQVLRKKKKRKKKKKRPDTPEREDTGMSAVSTQRVQLGLPETFGQDVIPSLPPIQTSDQVEEAPQFTPNLEKVDEQAHMMTDHETKSKKKRGNKKQEKRERERKELKEQNKGESDIEQEQEQANLMISNETTARKERKKRKKKEKRVMKKLEYPATMDEQTRNENTFYLSAQTHNADREMGVDGETEVGVEAEASDTEIQDYTNTHQPPGRKRRRKLQKESEDKEELLIIMND
ncbi:daf-12-interacting protein 1-like isoform X2 [Mizuhopecten yessoensis]|uniref:daf-12-interacting protein 1-like isoform X2 n=1 Tax=Mizuhopecten yessoensis TaxID=6573 RepID=UPI000B45A551|nr:daf-12-interacting protein 1-like isoform X2 [Mizuhopecten yessoensis]